MSCEAHQFPHCAGGPRFALGSLAAVGAQFGTELAPIAEGHGGCQMSDRTQWLWASPPQGWGGYIGDQPPTVLGWHPPLSDEPVVIWHRVVSAFRAPAKKPKAHTHVFGVGAIRETTGAVLAWAARDLEHYPGARFLDGTV